MDISRPDNTRLKTANLDYPAAPVLRVLFKGTGEGSTLAAWAQSPVATTILTFPRKN